MDRERNGCLHTAQSPQIKRFNPDLKVCQCCSPQVAATCVTLTAQSNNPRQAEADQTDYVTDHESDKWHKHTVGYVEYFLYCILTAKIK